MYEIRTITHDDVDRFRNRVSQGFGDDPSSDDASLDGFNAIFDLDRTFAAFDGGDIVGTGAAFSLGLTVPGGVEVPMAGTTVITVKPTHRRQGVFRSLMASHLNEVASRGEVLAGLWASESSLYGRFGYGPATFRHVVEIDTRAVEFLADSPKGSLSLLEKEDAEPVLRSVYEQARHTRAGMLTRSDAWWTHRLMADPESWRDDKSAYRYLVSEEDGSVAGYAKYRQRNKWENSIAEGEVDVVEIVATTSGAHSAIWRFLTSIDLFPNLKWWNMPVDDPLQFKVTDRRRIARKLIDGLWIRVMDVPAALTAREYESDGVVIFAVEDSVGPETTGTYRLEVLDGVGSCERVSATAEIAFRSEVLGSLYLGGGDALALGDGGRIDGDPGAVRTMHRLFRTDRSPWCPEVF